MPPQDPASDLENLSEQQLKFASWYVYHKILLNKILIGFLILFNVIFWGYGLYGLINYYLIDGPRFDQAMRELSQFPNFSAINAKTEPQSLAVGVTEVLSAGKGKYDLVAKVSNANPSWYAEFDYNFVADGKVLPVKHGFILPGEEKNLINLGVVSTDRVRQANLGLSNLRWQRIDPHTIPDYPTWKAERFNFSFEDVKFLPAAIGGTITISRVTFNAKNLTAYGFWDVGFYIFLYRGNSLVGVNFITLEEFLSGQTRPVEVSWFDPLPSVTQVKVVPEVNIFDPSVFMPVE